MQVHSSSLGALGLLISGALLLPLAACSTPDTDASRPEPVVQPYGAPSTSHVEVTRDGTAASASVGEQGSTTTLALTADEPVSSAPVTTANGASSAATTVTQPGATQEAVEGQRQTLEQAVAKLETNAAVTTTTALPVVTSTVTQGAGAQGPTLSKKEVVDTKTSIFGEPLYVNGTRITDTDIKLYLLYGPCRLMLEMYRIGMVIDDQIRRTAIENTESAIARREAEKPFASAAERKEAYDVELRQQNSRLQEKYTLSEQDFQEEYDETIKEFHQRYPVLDIPAEISRAFRSVEWYRIQLRQTLRFDRVFLPENPEEWPIVTLEAVRADSGDVLVDDARDSYKTRKEIQEKNGLKRLPKEDAIYVQMMRQIARDAMFSLCDFRTQPDAPEGIAVWGDADGDGKPEVQVTIDELWDKVKDSVSETEINEAKQWHVTSAATRDRQLKEGILTSDQDCKASLAEYVKQFDGTYFSLEVLATKTYYFPSVEAYIRYYCLFEGFKKMMEPKLVSGPAGDIAAPLRQWFDRANRIMGLGQVDPEVLLISALDVPHFRWKPDGWSWAKKTAQELKAKIDANTQAFNEQKAKELEAKQNGTTYVPEKPAVEPYRFWSQMMDDHSEYWDPPAPEGQGARGSDVSYKKKGRFGLRYRNDLISFVGETYFSVWTTGNSITDYIFFDQAEGTIAGPFKGPQGWYLTRVNKRTGPSRPLNLAEPKHVQLLKDDYLRIAFVEYAKEAVAQATVVGFSPTEWK